MRPILLALLLTGCDEMVYGVGSVYIYNGTEHAVRIAVEGRTPGEVSLKPERGQLLDRVVVGPYTFVDGERTIRAEVLPERLTLVNIEGAGCFARLDVLGMYQSGKPPVRVLQLYDGEEVWPLADLISIVPGARLPAAAPKTSYPFQRLIVVPCHLLEDERAANSKVAEYARRLR